MRIHQNDSSAPGLRARWRWPMGDRSGQVLALFAIAAVPLLAMLALGIDVGLLLTARNEAQRAANAGALAGASVFQGCKPLDCKALEGAADAKAMDFTTRNLIRDIQIAESEVTVQVLTDEKKVRVFVDRDGVPTFFAHLLGIPVAPIGAVAAAKISSGGTKQCVQPFFGPDLWDHKADDNGVPESDDDPWFWDPDNGDQYEAYDPNGQNGTGTGYGSGFRDGVVDNNDNAYTADFGRHVVISSTNAGQSQGALGSVIGPGNFQLWRVPIPDKDGNCDPEDPQYATGANDLKEIVSGEECGCPLDLVTEYEYETEPGGKWGGVKAGIDERMSMDPDAEWQEDVGVVSPDYPQDSPRIVTVAVSDPSRTFDINGQHPIEFNNFAEIFLEGYCDSNKVGQDAGALDCDEEFGKHTVIARFIGKVEGGAGPETGNLIEYLRLVE